MSVFVFRQWIVFLQQQYFVHLLRPPTIATMAVYEAQSLTWGFPRKHSNVSHIRKSYSQQCRAHLVVSTERVSSQTNKSCLCNSSSPFTMSFYNGLYDTSVIYVALIAMCMSLITSFQPPLIQTQHNATSITGSRDQFLIQGRRYMYVIYECSTLAL